MERYQLTFAAVLVLLVVYMSVGATAPAITATAPDISATAPDISADAPVQPVQPMQPVQVKQAPTLADYRKGYAMAYGGYQ